MLQSLCVPIFANEILNPVAVPSKKPISSVDYLQADTIRCAILWALIPHLAIQGLINPRKISRNPYVVPFESMISSTQPEVFVFQGTSQTDEEVQLWTRLYISKFSSVRRTPEQCVRPAKLQIEKKTGWKVWPADLHYSSTCDTLLHALIHIVKLYFDKITSAYPVPNNGVGATIKTCDLMRLIVGNSQKIRGHYSCLSRIRHSFVLLTTSNSYIIDKSY